MKKVLIIFVLLNMIVFSMNTIAKDEYESFMESLKLSNSQKVKIEQIEKNYNKKIVEANAQMLLNNMQIAKSGKKYRESQANNIRNQARSLEKYIYDLNEEKEEEILSTLNWFQRRKYKKFISKFN